VTERFRKIAEVVAEWAGSAWSFMAHLAGVLVFIIAGFFLGWSETMLVLTTVLTVFTELLAVLILNTQSRATRAMQVKVDELIRSSPEARNALIDLEHASDEQIEHAYSDLQRRRRRQRHLQQ
jgi:low affinity Fe/Cu permease